MSFLCIYFGWDKDWTWQSLVSVKLTCLILHRTFIAESVVFQIWSIELFNSWECLFRSMNHLNRFVPKWLIENSLQTNLVDLPVSFDLVLWGSICLKSRGGVAFQLEQYTASSLLHFQCYNLQIELVFCANMVLPLSSFVPKGGKKKVFKWQVFLHSFFLDLGLWKVCRRIMHPNHPAPSLGFGRDELLAVDWLRYV